MSETNQSDGHDWKKNPDNHPNEGGGWGFVKCEQCGVTANCSLGVRFDDPEVTCFGTKEPSEALKKAAVQANDVNGTIDLNLHIGKGSAVPWQVRLGGPIKSQEEPDWRIFHDIEAIYFGQDGCVMMWSSNYVTVISGKDSKVTELPLNPIKSAIRFDQ